jgi:predicted SAM-dependent methyltransferase
VRCPSEQQQFGQPFRDVIAGRRRDHVLSQMPSVGRCGFGLNPEKPEMDRRLHIGGREKRPGWEILDVNPADHVDHVGDAIDLGRFEDGSFVEIYASHVLEHFDYRDKLVTALREWHRVLTPGGVLRLSVPDMDILAHLLLQRHKLDVNQRFNVMRMIFGGHVDAHDYHLVGLNQDFLAGFLEAAGFDRMKRVTRHGLFNDTSDMVVAGTPISLNLTACKPAPVAAEAV